MSRKTAKRSPQPGADLEEFLALPPFDRIEQGLIRSRQRLYEEGRSDPDRPHRALDLYAICLCAERAELEAVVVGAVALLAHGVLRMVEAIELSVPEGPEVEEPLREFFEWIVATDPRTHREVTRMEGGEGTELQVDSEHGPVALRKSGPVPIDHESVNERAVAFSYATVAGLSSVVSEQRLRAPDDLQEILAALERANGPLPLDPIPGIDVCAAHYQGEGRARLVYDTAPGEPPKVVHGPGCCLSAYPVPGAGAPPRPMVDFVHPPTHSDGEEVG